MSDPVMHYRNVSTEVKITATEAAREFAESDASAQALFLLRVARHARSWEGGLESTYRQCEAIADKLSDSERREVQAFLDSLLEKVSQRSYRK